MTERREMIRALWCAAKAAGGTLRLGPSIIEDFPGDKDAFITIRRNPNFGDLEISAHAEKATEAHPAGEQSSVETPKK